MKNTEHDRCPGFCPGRREVLKAGAGGLAVGAMAVVTDAAAQSAGTPTAGSARSADSALYPRLRVGQVSRLREGEPLAFAYPLEQQPNLIIKLGAPAQGGVGPNRDIVAFSSLCTHMGGNLRGRYRHDLKAIGPCPFHFSTFDLTRGGVPVHASATQRLPQVILEVEDDDIFAVAVDGLIYGYRHNLSDGMLVAGAVPARKSGTLRG